MKPIKFRKVAHFGHKVKSDWQYAKNEKDLRKKMGPNTLAEVIMPAKPWYVRMWRWFFPLRGYKSELGVTYHFHNGKITAETYENKI